MMSLDPRETAVKVDGFQFETLILERRLPIVSEIKFGICITNQTLAPQRFLLFFLQPLLFERDQDWKPVSYWGVNANGIAPPASEDCQIVEPGKSVSFLVKGEFYRSEGESMLRYCNKSREYHFWQHFRAGIYGLQCQYICPIVGQKADYSAYQDVEYEDTWVGKVITPLVEFELINV